MTYGVMHPYRPSARFMRGKDLVRHAVGAACCSLLLLPRQLEGVLCLSRCAMCYRGALSAIKHIKSSSRVFAVCAIKHIKSSSRVFLSVCLCDSSHIVLSVLCPLCLRPTLLQRQSSKSIGIPISLCHDL